MATDGVKIIDGDYAHDVYHTFMDLYDAEASLAEITAAIEPLDFVDDFDNEIFVATYALALWEIGELTEEVRSRVAAVIQRGAFGAYLIEEEDLPAEGRRRQKVLERFWQKINKPNPRIRKRKKYAAQKRFVFQEGDVLTFQMPDGTYRATVLMLISQKRGRCDYYFAQSTYDGLHKPSVEDISQGELEGMIMPYGAAYEIGFSAVGIGHKHLRSAATQFKLIGTLQINPAMQSIGPQGGAIHFESFAGYFQHFDSLSGVKKTAVSHPETIFPAKLLLS